MVCLITGRPGAGRTTLLLTLAEHIGGDGARVHLELAGQRPGRGVPVRQARVVLRANPAAVGSCWLRVGPGHRTLVVDGAPLTGTVSSDPAVRAAQALTLRYLQRAAAVFQVVLANADGLEAAEVRLAEVLARRSGHVLLVGMMDLPGSLARLRAAERSWPGGLVLPVSGRNRSGLREIGAYLRRAGSGPAGGDREPGRELAWTPRPNP